MANIRIAPITTKKKKQDEIRIAPILTEEQKRQQAMEQSKVMREPMEVSMMKNNINNQIAKNIVSGGIQNDIHTLNMAKATQPVNNKIDLSGKSVMGKTTPVDTSDFIYNDTGKKYGDYYYDNYELYKDMPIYEQHGKYYLKTNKGYEELGKLDKNGNVAQNIMTNEEAEQEELEKAKKLGYKDNITKITTQDYDDAQDTFKRLKKEYKLSDKELNNWIKTGDLPIHVSIQTNSMSSLKNKAEEYRTKINSGKIKQYNQQGFGAINQLDIDLQNMSDEEKQHYISSVTGKKDPTLKNENTFFKGSSVFDDGYQFGDISKATLGTIGNAGYSLLKGTGKFIEGTSDFAENLIGSGLESFASDKDKKDVKEFRNNTWNIGYKYGNKNYWYDEKNNKLYDENWNRVYNFDLSKLEKRYTYSNGVAEFGRQMKEQTVKDEMGNFFDETIHGNDLRNLSVLGNKSEAMLESMGQALPLMGAGATVGGLYGEGSAVATTSGLTFASTYGNAKTEAIRNGATEKEAMQTAFVQATAETISEQFFDAIPGAKSAGWGEKLVGKVGNSVEKYMGSRTAKIVTKALDISGEGFEEIISNMLTAGGNDIVHFIDKDFNYGMENQSGNILDDMTKAMTSQDSMDSFISAIITSALLNAGSSKINSSNENQIINEIVRTYAKEYNMSIDEAKNRLKINGDNIEFDTSNINQNQNTPNLPNNSAVEQRNINNNTNNQVSDNVQNSMVRTQNNNKVNPPISTTFLNSAKENNYNSNSEVIRNANSIMLKRGIEGRFDSKFFTNNSENALWRKDENGKRSVIFNPNADENAIFQNVVIHEMVHDVLSSKNNADVLNVEDILDFVSKTSGYESARMNLEETYSKVYDRNSDQFKEMVDEEVIATVLGNKLGSQEYINRLNGQKPNLARRIYNWIVNKLDSLSKALGHQSEKAYWRDVANRFEKAFNGEYNSDLNDNTKYMMTSVKGMNNGINTDNKNFNTYQKYKNGIEEPDNSSFSLKEQVEIARKEFMDSKEKYGFDEKTKELQKKYNKLLTKLNQTENPVQKDIRPQIEKDVDGIVKDLLRTMEQDIIDDQFIDESIEETKYYKDNYIDETDEDILEELGIDQDEAYRRNRELTDEIYDKLMNKLKDEGISIRYDKNGNAIYDRQELAIKGYNELLDYLDDKNINYEVSRSSEAGYVPSIYIKNSDGEVILRIANHKNHNLSDYDIQVDEKYNKLFSDKEYANWKEKIVPKIEENFEKFEWYDKDNQKYSQKSQTWDEFVENNFKSSGTRTKFSEIKAPINPNAITNQNKIKPPIAKEYQKNTIDEKIEKSNTTDVLEFKTKQIAPIVENKINRKIEKSSKDSIVNATKVVKKGLDLSSKEKQSFKEKLKKYENKTYDEVVNGKTYNEIRDIIKEYSARPIENIDEEMKSVKSEIKNRSIKIDDNLKVQITDYNDFRKSMFGKLKLSNEGTSIDSLYNELSNSYPYYFDSNINTEVDMLYELADFMNKDVVDTQYYYLTNTEIERYTAKVFNELKNGLITDEQIQEIREGIENKKNIISRQDVKNFLLDKTGLTIKDISVGKDISKLDINRTDPIRVNEKVFGPEIGKKINEAIFYVEKHNEADRQRWLNVERDDIKKLGIKPRSKESAAVQKYGEKKYINEYGEIVEYGDKQLAQEFPNIKTQNKIKHASKILREKYDIYIDQINNVLEEMGYKPIQKRADYFRHFQALEDVFSRHGLPVSKETLKEDLLPTDINGLTDEFKPGKQWFANAMKRTGMKTTYDAITGIDGYLEGASNLIFHTEDIQRYRAFSDFIRNTYGEMHGFDNLEHLTEEEVAQRIEDIQSHKLSKYVAWLDEQANALANKKGRIDRAIESLADRKVYNILNAAKQQVGSNMTGFNIGSAFTNFASAVQGASKTSKLSFVKGSLSTIKNMFHRDNLIDKSDFLTSRLNNSQSIAKKTWQKARDIGQIFMNGTDWLASNQIWRSKYFENIKKGMSEEIAIKNADDFAARIMGDRSKGATAQIFNSKTLGIFSQFQLEVNNQWSSLIHDNKMDIKSKNKTLGGVLFQTGQLFALSHLFNVVSKSIMGREIMLDPLEMLFKLLGWSDEDKDKTWEERTQDVLDNIVDNLPFANLITPITGLGSGGRIPISEAFRGAKSIPGIALGTEKDDYGNKLSRMDSLQNLLGSVWYWIFPTGYGQVRKTTHGLSMFINDKEIKGSYTKKGNLRFPVKDTIGNRVQAGLFGEYASKEARQYFNQGRLPLKENQFEDYKTLNIPISDYWVITKDLSTLKKKLKGKKTDERKKVLYKYIDSLDVSQVRKDILKKSEYKTYTDGDNRIIKYINNSNMSKKSKDEILKKLGLDK